MRSARQLALPWGARHALALAAVALLVGARPAGAANELTIGGVAGTSLPQASVGQAYQLTFAVSGGVAPYQWRLVRPMSRSPLGAGWLLSAGGTLTGTPALGTGPDGNPSAQYVEGFRVLVTDALGRSGQRSFEVAVVDAAPAPTVATRAPLLPAVAGQPYALALRAGSGRVPFTWSVSAGALPTGLSLGADGLLAGTPTSAGSFTFTAAVRDADGRVGSGPLTLSVAGAGPVEFTVDGSTVLRTATPRIGTNVSGEGTYWDDAGAVNQLVTNPGLEPSHARRMYRAWTGSATTVEEWDHVQYAEIAELQTGYWDGGRYWILSGPAKGRSGTIAGYQRVQDVAAPFGWRGVWTFADSDAQRVVATRTDPDADFGLQDIFMVEPAGVNATSELGVLPAGWSPDTGWGVTASQVSMAVDPVVKHSGLQSARVVSTVQARTGVWSLVLWDNPLRRLRRDTTYRYAAWVRQQGVSGGRVTLELAGPWGGSTISSTSAVVPDDGQFHRIEGELAGGGEAQVGISVSIGQPGTLWVDDVLLWEAQSTTAGAHQPAGATTVAPAFAPLPFVVKDLRDLGAGTLRFWYYEAGLTLAEALRASSADDASGGNHNLFADLSLADAVGATPWIIAAKEWTPAEMVELLEYLASPDTTQGLGKLRADQGHPAPWTRTFGRIDVEYSNEAWNWPSYAYPFDLWHPDLYAGFASERFAAMKASPLFDPTVLTLIANGQVGDDFWVNDPVEAQTYPAADALDNAPYLTSALELPWGEGGRQMVGWVGETTAALRGTVKLWRDRGHDTELLVYEGGPGPALYNPPMGEEARHASAYYAALFADSVADLFQDGLGAYNQFTYQNAIAWKAATGHSSRLRYPTGHAMALFNAAAGGKDQLAVTSGSGAPTLTPLTRGAWPDLSFHDGAPEEAVRCRAYGDGDALGLLLVNRNPLAGYPVVVHTGLPGRTFAVRTLASDEPLRGGLEGLGLTWWGGDEVSKIDPEQLFEAVTPVASAVDSDASGDLSLRAPAGALVTAVAGAAAGPGTVPGGRLTAGCGCGSGGADGLALALLALAVAARPGTRVASSWSHGRRHRPRPA